MTTTLTDPTAARSDGRHDFDFLLGTWTVHHRRLRHPLTGSAGGSAGGSAEPAADWYEFEGRCVEHPLWDGRGNIEELEADAPTGPLRGAALRLYRPEARQWAIHWASGATGRLDAPMVGAFSEGRGEFYGQDEFEGRAILLRFIWTPVSRDACRWEQAFSDDGGTTWETNWVMEFRRSA